MFEEDDYDLISYNITEFIAIFLDRISFGCDDKVYTRQKILLTTCRDVIAEYAMNYGNKYIDGDSEEIMKEIADYIGIINNKN